MPRRVEKKVPGIFERVKGSGDWWIRFKHNGVERREKAGTRGDAINLYRDRKTAILRGEKLPATLKKPGVRFSEIGEDAIEWYRTTRKKDLRTFSGRMRTIIDSPLGSKPADSITHEDIERWLNSHREWSPATCNRYRTTFSRAYSLGLKSRVVSSNPAALVDKRTEDNEKTRYLTVQEETRLIEAVKGSRPDQLPALLFPLHTGARKSEQFKLTWDNVNLDLHQVTLNNTKRRGLTRYVQLNRTALEALSTIARSADNDFVFQSSRGGRALQDPKKWFEAAVKEARIENFTWHDLRHTFISRLVMLGVPLGVVGKIVGHGSERMTERYAHLAPTTAQAAVNLLDPAEAAAITALDKL